MWLPVVRSLFFGGPAAASKGKFRVGPSGVPKKIKNTTKPGAQMKMISTKVRERKDVVSKKSTKN